jgi:hypothetical protein
VLGGEVGEVEAGARDEVLGLADVHPEAGKVERVQLVVGSDFREDLLLDRGRAELGGISTMFAHTWRQNRRQRTSNEQRGARRTSMHVAVTPRVYTSNCCASQVPRQYCAWCARGQ